MSEQQEKLKIGDIVKLKSDGPKMTIDSKVGKETDKHLCVWFLNDVLFSGTFSLTSLIKAD